MELILQIVSGTPGPKVGKEHLRVFDEQGSTISRARDRLWVIPKPKSLVPLRHRVIEQPNGAYWLRDVSSNGVMLNGATEGLEFGQLISQP